MESSVSTIRMITIPMEAALSPLGFGGVEALRCLKCQNQLDLVQPSVASPELLMGTCHHCCSKCNSLHVIDWDNYEAVMVILPSYPIVRAASVLAAAAAAEAAKPACST